VAFPLTRRTPLPGGFRFGSLLKHTTPCYMTLILILYRCYKRLDATLPHYAATAYAPVRAAAHAAYHLLPPPTAVLFDYSITYHGGHTG